MTIGTGFATHTDPENTTLSVTLLEDSWYHVPDSLSHIPASSFSGDAQPPFLGARVDKDDFMRVLGSLDRMLVRAKFHTDQLEGT